jgi:CRP/FNR family transcriptional regulator, cyclic AMP receptor protein
VPGSDPLWPVPGSWFGTLSQEHRRALIEAGRGVSVSGGEAVYRQGDLPNGLWGVVTGEVRLLGYPTPGSELLALTVQPGGWFGEVSMIDGGPRPHDAVAHGPARLHHVSPAALSQLAARVPLIYHDVARLACQHQRAALDYISRALTLSTEARLAQLLLGLTRAEAGELALRQEDVAAMLGVSRQTLSRHLGVLATAGCIARSYARITVMDRASLSRRANASESGGAA